MKKIDNIIDWLKKYKAKNGEDIPFRSYYFDVYKNILRDHPLIYKARKTNNYRIGNRISLTIKKLLPTQSSVNVDNLIDILLNKGPESSIDAGDEIAVAKYNGKFYILNGHHRIWLAMANHESSMDVYLFDIDAYEKNRNNSLESKINNKDLRKIRSRQNFKDMDGLIEWLEELLNNGVYKIPLKDKYDYSFWTSPASASPKFQAFLRREVKASGGSIAIDRAKSLEDSYINISHALAIAKGEIKEKVVAIYSKPNYWIINGFTTIWVMLQIGIKNINGDVLEI